MTITELLPQLQHLSRFEKLAVIKFLVNELEKDENLTQIRLEELRRKIAIGTQQIAEGKVTDGEIVFDSLKEKLSQEYGLEK